MGSEYDGFGKSVAESFGNAIGHVGNAVEDAAAEALKDGKSYLSKLFGDEAFNPVNQDIYDRRVDIAKNFFNTVLEHDVSGGAVSPLAVEEFEQLLEVFGKDLPDVSISQLEIDILQRMKDDPAKYGVETSSPVIFSDNEGLAWEPSGQ